MADGYLNYAQMALSERRFPEAIARAKQAIEAAGSQYINVVATAKSTLGLAQVLSGAKREGLAACEEALELATRAGDTALLSGATLALAEAKYESEDDAGALEYALRAQERLARGGQKMSEWRAWLIAARASQRRGDQNAADAQMKQAADILSLLRQKWRPDTFKSYAERPDVRLYIKQLGAAFTAEPESN
jgi:tetratricopeptide (TPR) repeat protein